MAKHNRKARSRSRDAPQQTRGSIMLCSQDAWKTLCSEGYRPVTQCPEVQMCINAYARSVAMMTIQLMRNVHNGDERIRNELSRKIDISPTPYMTRTNMMYMIVKQMMETGNQITYPQMRGGLIEWLLPLRPSQAMMVEDGDGYRVRYRGAELRPDEVLNFVYNPDPEQPWRGRGVQVDVKEFVKAIRQANTTRNALLESPAPSVIVRVDGLIDEFRSPEGRAELQRQYVDSQESGRPWFVPSEAFEIQTLKPMSITDLAIKDNLELDKRAIAAMIGVTPHMVGIGAYNEQEYNNFVATKIPFVSQIIEQEMTSKLLISHDMYIRLNKRSLMSYALKDLSDVARDMTDHMAMRRNEWRKWVDLPPDDEMDELLALENYVPADKLGDQKKLKGGASDGGKDDQTQTAESGE